MKRHRSVLSRLERVKILQERGILDLETGSILGLPKVKHLRIKMKKEKAATTAAAGTAAAGATPAAAATPAAPAAGAKAGAKPAAGAKPTAGKPEAGAGAKKKE